MKLVWALVPLTSVLGLAISAGADPSQMTWEQMNGCYVARVKAANPSKDTLLQGWAEKVACEDTKDSSGQCKGFSAEEVEKGDANLARDYVRFDQGRTEFLIANQSLKELNGAIFKAKASAPEQRIRELSAQVDRLRKKNKPTASDLKKLDRLQAELTNTLQAYAASKASDLTVSESDPKIKLDTLINIGYQCEESGALADISRRGSGFCLPTAQGIEFYSYTNIRRAGQAWSQLSRQDGAGLKGMAPPKLSPQKTIALSSKQPAPGELLTQVALTKGLLPNQGTTSDSCPHWPASVGDVQMVQQAPPVAPAPAAR